ncbi:MAG: signal peptidase I [Acutalibacteraceae bacterium]
MKDELDSAKTVVADDKPSEKKRFRLTGRRIFYIIFVCLTLLISAAVFFIPVIHIDSVAMEPTITKGDTVISFSTGNYQSGDILAIKYGGKLLVKRCIAVSGQTVDIDKKGNVTIDGKALDEPYLKHKSLGNCTVDLPYKVPDGSYFCMGDNRVLSVDSRSEAVGAVKNENVIGKVVFCIWPLTSFGIKK